MWSARGESEVRSGQVRSGQVRSGQVRSDRVGSGRVRSGQVGSGQVRSDRVGSGQVRSGQVRSGHGRTNKACSVFSTYACSFVRKLQKTLRSLKKKIYIYIALGKYFITPSQCSKTTRLTGLTNEQTGVAFVLSQCTT